MPLYKVLNFESTEVYLWKFSEEDDLNPNVWLSEDYYNEVKDTHPKKITEAVMVRRLLHEKYQHTRILYDNKAPYLDPKHAEISISHSFPFAALAFSKRKIGIDLEKVKPKILHVLDKFIQVNERDFVPENDNISYYTTIWSIKESLYKMHHSKYWSLKKHYKVFPFELSKDKEIQCSVHDEKMTENFVAKIHRIEDYIFTLVEY